MSSLGTQPIGNVRTKRMQSMLNKKDRKNPNKYSGNKDKMKNVLKHTWNKKKKKNF